MKINLTKQTEIYPNFHYCLAISFITLVTGRFGVTLEYVIDKRKLLKGLSALLTHPSFTNYNQGHLFDLNKVTLLYVFDFKFNLTDNNID